MTDEEKRKEVDRILILYTGRTNVHLDVVKNKLAEAGVVIKVKMELPAYGSGSFECWSNEYEATIPLIGGE